MTLPKCHHGRVCKNTRVHLAREGTQMRQSQSEQVAPVNGIQLCYETFGAPDDPALLLIMGLGGQMIWWDDELCRELAASGFHLSRYDNRDAVRSTIFHRSPVPKPRQLRRRDPDAAPYSLDDMAADA